MDYHFVYQCEVDISVDNGRGINEREFVRALLECLPDQVTCILPRPEHPDRFSDPRIEYVRGHYNSPVRYGLHLLDAYRRLRTVHARRPVSALITRLQVAPVVPLLARERLGIPTIVKSLGMGYDMFGAGRLPKAHEVVSWALSPVFRSVVEGCVLADTTGESVAEWVGRHYRIPKNRLVVVPNGANTDVFVPGDRLAARRALGLERFNRIVGYAGILAGERNLEVLVEEMAALQRSDVALVLAGAGPLRQSLEELADRLGVRDRVIFLGQIEYHRVPALMRALDIAVDLSLVHLRVGKRDVIPASFSQKLAQYLAAGVPVLAWNLPDTRVIEKHDVGRVVPLGQPRAVGRALAEILSLSADEMDAMSRRSRGVAERQFSIRELVRRRIALWKETVRPSRGRGEVA